ncbi:hypothetical protein [Amycolatopsis sp. NPDC004079]|uniref:hypothetical protein n=1 Tax=Amycolatopsis sp. NPDC004079 TaxID=3154549 RepID=UPI0033A3AEEC
MPAARRCCLAAGLTAASCPLGLDVWELCAAESGAFLVRRTSLVLGRSQVWETYRREDEEEPMRGLFERIMRGEAR